MAWRLAHSLSPYLKAINAAAPNRDKSSDGGIGDAAHASRGSDHNPWIKVKGIGVVRAYDITHDPEDGLDSYVLAEHLRVKADPRLDYIISNYKIADHGGPWRPYKCPPNKNPHSHHVHISLSQSESLFDDPRPWDLGLGKAPIIARAVAAVTKAVAGPKITYPTIRRGSVGASVRKLQALLKIKVDGQFGPATEDAVIVAQKKHGLVADGKVGPYTWRALGA